MMAVIRANAEREARRKVLSDAAQTREFLDELLCSTYPDDEGFTVTQVLDAVTPLLNKLQTDLNAEIDMRLEAEREVGAWRHIGGTLIVNAPTGPIGTLSDVVARSLAASSGLPGESRKDPTDA